MLNCLKEVVSCRALVASAALLTGLATPQAQAGDIPLINGSFELPEIPELPAEPTDLDFVNFGEITGWQKFGPFKQLVPGVVEGTLDTGVFLNAPFDPGTGTLVSAIPNADGNQLAFMVVDAAASGAETVSILQTTGQTFEVGQSYDFTIGVGTSLNTPLGVLTGATPLENPETVELIIGYGATNGSDITAVSTRVVSALELSVNFGTYQVPLTDFTASSSVLGGSDAAIGQQIQVLVRQVGGTSGAFNLDNARLSSVPEPTSLAVIGLAGLCCIRRRR